MMEKKMICLILIGSFVIGTMLVKSPMVCCEQDDIVKITLSKASYEFFLPVDIVDATVYRDGGTIAITVKDSHGNEAMIYLKSLGVVYVGSDMKAKSRQRLIYIGMHKVIIGSKEEKKILHILENAIAKGSSEEAEIKLDGLKLGLVRSVIGTLKSR
ncbi:MAG: hypothetical protein ABIA97_03360 [Candidatus Omnitrophota bacterium]